MNCRPLIGVSIVQAEVWKEIEGLLRHHAYKPQIIALEDIGKPVWSLVEPESLIRFVKVEDVYLKNDLYMIMQRLGAEKGFSEFARRKRFRALCTAAYDHVRSYGWIFDYEQGSPDYGRQVIRTLFDVLRDQRACCLDLACLFAALLENMQVKPVILRVLGDRFAHALAGYWKGDGAGQPVIREGEFVRKAVRRDDMVLFETTGAVRTPSPIGGEPRKWREKGNGFLAFGEAVKTARNLVLSTSVQIDFLLDVVAAREV